MKTYLYFYIISILLLVNDALANWFGTITGLAPWRQIIWLAGVYSMFMIFKKHKQNLSSTRVIIEHYMSLFVVVIFLSLMTLFFGSVSVVRILLSIIEYFYGLPFVLFPFVCSKCGWSRGGIDKFFIYIGVAVSAGFIIDYSMNGAITLAFNALNTRVFDEFQFEYGRYNFLSTSNTLLTMTLCVSIMCIFHTYQTTKKKYPKIYLIALSIFIVFGSIYCGARQTLVGLLFIEAAGLLSIIKHSKVGVVSVGFFFALFLLILPTMQSMLSENKGFSERYTSESIKEDERSETWKQGWKYCITEASAKRLLIGEGVGYTLNTHVSSREKKGRHFESSFFARISEVGVLTALFLLLIPVIYILKRRRNCRYSVLYIGALLTYMFISIVSPNGLANQTQMALFILLGLFMMDKKQEPMRSYEKYVTIRIDNH